MHKCIMVKLGGNETHKVCKRRRIFYEIKVKFAKVGNKKIPQIGLKCTKTAKVGGKFTSFCR